MPLKDDNKSAYELSKELGVEEFWERKNPFVEALKTGLLGALCGAVIAVAAGFAFLGWATPEFVDDRVEAAYESGARDARVKVCVGQFLNAPDHLRDLNVIQELDDYARPRLVAQKGWATLPGSQKPNLKLARACADAILKLVDPGFTIDTIMEDEIRP